MKVIQRIRRNKEYTFHSLNLWYIWNKDNSAPTHYGMRKWKINYIILTHFNVTKFKDFKVLLCFYLRRDFRLLVASSDDPRKPYPHPVIWFNDRAQELVGPIKNSRISIFTQSLAQQFSVFIFFFVAIKHVRVYCRQVMQMFNYISRDMQ